MSQNTLACMFKEQAAFNENFFDNNLSQKEKEQLTMVFVASMQKELGSLLDAVNFRQHRLIDKVPEVDTIKHEGIDVFRYLIAIMNLWGITPEDFDDAWIDRNLFLQMRHKLESTPWDGRPVLVVDIDDVVTPFRHDCTAWVRENYPEIKDITENSYYSIPPDTYRDYIQKGMLKIQGVNSAYVEVINKIHDAGVWVHMLTARPSENLTVKYDTYYWLNKSGLKFDRVSFSKEKFLWVAQTDYYKQGKVIAAVDDSPKHAAEYATHDVKCFVPGTTYNTEMVTGGNIIRCDSANDFLREFKNLTSMYIDMP